MDAFSAFRLVVGIIFAFFVPGLSWSYLLFARREVPIIERVAISIGLSMALVPLTMFWLAWLVNVKVTMVNTVLVVLALTAVPLVILWGRKTERYKKLAGELRARLPGAPTTASSKQAAQPSEKPEAQAERSRR